MEKEELAELIQTIIKINREFSKEQLNFTNYCLEKMEDRGVNQDLVISLILEKEPYYIEKQKRVLQDSEETRYKLVYRVSSKYSIILIISYNERILNVINVIKTSKKAEKLWRKNLSK